MPSLKSVVVSLIATACRGALAWPQPPMHGRIVQRQEDVRHQYDYIIVGGGTAGLTVGDRLTENGKCERGNLNEAKFDWLIQ